MRWHLFCTAPVFPTLPDLVPSVCSGSVLRAAHAVGEELWPDCMDLLKLALATARRGSREGDEEIFDNDSSHPDGSRTAAEPQKKRKRPDGQRTRPLTA
eukprot:m.109328 g.109328  ORF g.109328 m.109328 type:complete len:99 (+) comp15975_c0_seq2:125-421(+)